MRRKIFFSSIMIWMSCLILFGGVGYWLTPFLLGTLFLFPKKLRYFLPLVLFGVTLVHMPMDVASFIRGEVEIRPYKYGIQNPKIVVSSDGKYICYDQDIAINTKGYIVARKQFFSKKVSNSLFQERAYYKSLNIKGVLVIESWKEKEKLEKTTREKMLDVLYQRLNKFSQRELVFSMLFGQRSLLDQSLNEQLKELGLIHLFVVSGLHFHIIASSIQKFLKRLLFPKVLRDALVIIILGGLCYITNFHVSSLRALLMILINTVLFYKKESIDPLDALGIAILIILFINPYNSMSLSFLLGILCYLGITQFKGGILAIYIAGLPILLKIGYQPSIFSILLGIVIGYSVTYLLPLLFLSLIFGPIQYIIDPVLNGIIFAVKATSTYNFQFFHLFPLSLFSIGSYYLILISYFFAKDYIDFKNIQWSKKGIALAACFAWILIAQIYHFRIEAKGIHFIDVNQGDGALIVTEDYRILIDTGNSKNILSYLENYGIDSIDAIFISHFDLDHVGMLENIDYQKLYVSHKEKGLAAHLVRRGDIFTFNECTITVLYPSDICESSNENSMILLVDDSSRQYLFTGDSTKDKFQYYTQHVEIFKFPHHGSKTGLAKERIKKINPDYSVLSYGRNYYGHPHKEVIEFLDFLGSTNISTYESGNLHFRKRTKNFK